MSVITSARCAIGACVAYATHCLRSGNLEVLCCGACAPPEATPIVEPFDGGDPEPSFEQRVLDVISANAARIRAVLA